MLGPDAGFIAGNTEISLALTMTIPLLRWLQLQSPRRWVRWAVGAGMGLTAIAILGSYSRGGLLAICAMAGFLWLKSRQKIVLGIGFVLLIPLALVAMPDRWFERMGTIATYEQDSSAMGRINAWGFALNLVQARPLTGGGFETFERSAFQTWAPNPLDYHDAHSIWFEVLGEQGIVGLALYLLLWALTWREGNLIIRTCRKKPHLRWAADLAGMIQVSLIGYWVGGSFLGLAYWDYPYVLLAILVLTRVILTKGAESTAPESAPDMAIAAEAEKREKPPALA